MIMMGTIVNALGVLLGGAVGLVIHKLLHRGIPERFSEIIMKGIGLCVVYIAFGGILDGSNALITIFSMVLGVIIGEWLDIDGRVQKLSEKLEKRFAKDGDSSFSQGFMTATLLFCVGTMAIKGSLDSGISCDHATLYAKSMMDTISACVFASSLGVGVLFSSVPVLIYQGTITLLATVAAPFLSEVVIAEMNTVGSLLLFGLALNLLNVTKLKLMNYIPAMFLPIIFCLFM